MQIRDAPILMNDGFGARPTPALNIHGNWILTDVRVSPLDVDGERSRGTAKSLRTDARLIDRFQEPCFQLRDFGVRVVRADLAESACVFGQLQSNVRCSAKAYADNHRRTRPRAGFKDASQNEALHANGAFGRIQHPEKAPEEAARALEQRGFEPVGGCGVAVGDQHAPDADRIVANVPAEMCRKSATWGSPADCAAVGRDWIEAGATFVGVLDVMPLHTGAEGFPLSIGRMLEVAARLKA